MVGRRVWRHFADESGASIIEDLLALMLLALVFAVGVQGFAYAQARSVAVAAAQEGANDAASNGPNAGIEGAQQVLDAGGGAAHHLSPTVTEGTDTVTVTVAGQAPQLFPLSILLPTIRTSATDPLEQYPTNEQAAGQ